MRHEVHSIHINDTSLDKGVIPSSTIFYATNACDILEVKIIELFDALESADATEPIERTTTTHPLEVYQYIPRFAWQPPNKTKRTF